MNTDRTERLEYELNELRQRVWALEEVLHQQVILPPKAPPMVELAAPPIPNTAPSANASSETAPAESPRVAPIFFSTMAAEDHPTDATESLESRIGSQWFNRIGIVALLVGIAWFIKFAIDNHWIGPVGRVMIGLAAGAGLCGWSESFRNKGFAAFSYSLKAVGSGALYLSLWAAFQLYHLLPAPVAFVAMVAITGLNGFMAWAQDAELLALYAIAGCLSTPLLVSTGENHELALFSYLLIMDLAVLVLVTLKPWARLLGVTFTGSMLFLLAWWMEYYSREQSLLTAFFALCFFFIFAMAPRLVLLHADATTRSTTSLVVAENLLPIANAAVSTLIFLNLVDTPPTEWAKPWVVILMALFYLGLVRLSARGWLHSASALLNQLHLTTAIVLLTIAIPLKAHGRWLTVGWLMEAALLIWVARRNRSALLQVLSTGCLALGLIALLTCTQPAAWMPFLNQRFSIYVVAIGVCAFVAWTAQQAHAEQQQSAWIPWQGLALSMALSVSLLILLAVGLEIDAFWWHLRWKSNPGELADFQMYAQFTYSTWFMLYGAVLLALGMRRRSVLLRWQALVLLALTIAKVFLVDTSQLGQGLRILSFLGLGGLLLGVSFLYQRDYLQLRAPSSHEEEK